MASGTAIPLHTHIPEEIYIIVSGTGLMILGDREIQVKSSQSFFIPSGVIHGIRNNGKEILKFSWVFDAPDWNEIEYNFNP